MKGEQPSFFSFYFNLYSVNNMSSVSHCIISRIRARTGFEARYQCFTFQRTSALIHHPHPSPPIPINSFTHFNMKSLFATDAFFIKIFPFVTEPDVQRKVRNSLKILIENFHYQFSFTGSGSMFSNAPILITMS